MKQLSERGNGEKTCGIEWGVFHLDFVLHVEARFDIWCAVFFSVRSFFQKKAHNVGIKGNSKLAAQRD